MNTKSYIFSHRFLLGAILLLALALRLNHLDFQSLWLDEIYTMNMANPDNSFGEIYKLSHSVDPLSVLYFFLMNTFFKIIGYTAWAARFFSLLFGLAGISFAYLLGKELRNRSTGLIAAVLLSVNYFHIFYSQEARVYSMFSALTCLSFYFLVRYIKNPNRMNSIYYGFSALLMILSHFFGLFTLVSQILVLVISAFFMKQISLKRYFIQTLVPAAIVIIGYIPIIPIFLVLTKNTSTWIPPILNTAFSTLIYNFFGDSYMLVSLAGFITIFYAFYVFKDQTEDSTKERPFEGLVPAFILLSMWIMITFFIPYVRSFLDFPILNSRYMISFLPAFMIMMAIGFDLIKNIFLKVFMVLFFVFVSYVELVYVKAYYKNTTKSSFRETALFVVENNTSEAKICTSLPYHYGYYLRSYNNKAFIDGTPIDVLMDLYKSGAKQVEPFWVVDAHGRKLTLSTSNADFLNKQFEEVLKYDGYDAWAKFYVPRAPQDTAQNYLQLNASNYFEKVPYEHDLNMYLNTNAALESKAFELEEGNFQLVLKARSTPALPINNTQAHLNIYVNNVLSAAFYLNAQSNVRGDTIAFSSSGKAPVKFKIEFDNDTTLGELDRNVIIRELRLLKK